MVNFTLILNSLVVTTLFILKTVPIIALVFYVVSYSINRGLMQKIALKMQHFLKKLNLSPIAIASIATCFVSPTAAYSILSQGLKEGEIKEKEVIATSFLNSFPSMFSHLYTFFIPFVIPVLGWAGIVYSITRFGVAIIKSAIGYFMALKWKSDNVRIANLDSNKLDPLRATIDNLKRILPTMFLTFFIVNLLSAYGIFNTLKSTFKFVSFLDPNVLAIAAIEFVNVRAAIIFAAGLLEAAKIDAKWVVVGLLLGNVISFSTRSVKHSLPMHISFFGKLGIKIVVLNSIVTFLLDVVIIVLLILFL